MIVVQQTKELTFLSCNPKVQYNDKRNSNQYMQWNLDITRIEKKILEMLITGTHCI
jgi:hypothetical protein